MKVYRIDTKDGYQETLTEKELANENGAVVMAMWEQEEIRETGFTVRQLNRARKLKKDEYYMDSFEEEYDYCPSEHDILVHLYGDL